MRSPKLYGVARASRFSLLEMDLTDRPADAAAPHQLSPQERAGDDLLAPALRRARWTIFWERLWPALASIATVIGLFLALSWLGLALAAAGRPRRRPWHFLPAHRGRVRACVDAARAEPHRRSATARSQFRLAASAGDRHRRRDRGPDRRFVFGRVVACPYRARPARGQDAQSRDSDAAARAARSLCRARLGGGAGGRDVLRCRR